MRQINLFPLFVIAIGFVLAITKIHACQPILSNQLELIRERFRTETVLFPPPELQNLTSSQRELLNKTIDRLIRLQSTSNYIPYNVENDFLRAMRAEAQITTHG
jgi:hypothetical protein